MCHIHHFFQARSYQSWESYNIRFHLNGFAHYLLSRDHHTHVHHLIAIAGKNDSNDILSDIVDVAFHSRQQHFSCSFAAFGLLGLDIGL